MIIETIFKRHFDKFAHFGASFFLNIMLCSLFVLFGLPWIMGLFATVVYSLCREWIYQTRSEIYDNVADLLGIAASLLPIIILLEASA